MSDENSDRLKAQLGGFSEITAISQRAINAAMVKLVTDHPEVAHVDCETKMGNSLKATIDRPEVALKITGESRADLEYFAHFASGGLHFNYDPPLAFDVKGWKVAFNVKIDQIDLEPGSDEYEQVKGRIEQPGDFSIRSLFLTFNMGDIIKLNIDHCDFKGARLDEDDILTLGGLLAKWYIDEGPMTQRQNRTIGYGLHTRTPEDINNEAPTFPPTSLKFQTYEYIAPGKAEPEEGIPAGDNNMLLYLQMTDNQPFPTTAILPYSGNFASKGMDGTMCIERGIFWDKYLLRTIPPELLHTLNHATYVWVEHADVDHPTKPDWVIGTGDSTHSASPDFFHWEPNGTLDWTWGLPQKKSEQHYWKHHIVGDSDGTLGIDCTTYNTMSAQPGSNVIHITGKSDVKVDGSCGSTGGGMDPWSCEWKLHVWLEWATTITLVAVDTGGLEVRLDLNDDTFQIGNDKLLFDGLEIGITREDVEKRQGELQDNFKETLRNSSLNEIKDKLQSNLNNAARFVVPGLGTFRYKDPVFNDYGDLLVQVSYQ
ncbi:hypothetical protein MW887_000923 [Aspergillus wentii]|nr:hypothetical protein MW887_000923 [Aspergillus wentii]